MIIMTDSLEKFLLKNYPKLYVLIRFGHIEVLTDDIYEEYLESLKNEGE